MGIASYLGIATGPSISMGAEEGVSFPVDGSKASLRLGSPFTFRIVPPPTLLAALQGQGEANRAGSFDAVLAQQRFEVEGQVVSGSTTSQELDQLTGTRAPATPSFAVIDAALATTTNFRQVQDQRRMVQRSLFSGQTARSTPLIGGNGKRFTDEKPAGGADLAMSDLAQGRSILAQVRQMLATPPLTLLVNPQSLAISFTKKQSFQERSRNGYIFQSWGEDLPKLSVSGKTGAFYAGTTGVNAQGQTDSPSGVQWITRRDSAAWQNLASLLVIYRNNGILYDLLGRTEAHLWVGNIEISYDQNVYEGQFESFQYGFAEDHQNGGVEWSFEFRVSAMYDLGQRGPVLPQASPTPSPSDPRWLGPLQPGLTGGASRQPAAVEDTSTAILDPFVG